MRQENGAQWPAMHRLARQLRTSKKQRRTAEAKRARLRCADARIIFAQCRGSVFALDCTRVAIARARILRHEPATAATTTTARPRGNIGGAGSATGRWGSDPRTTCRDAGARAPRGRDGRERANGLTALLRRKGVWAADAGRDQQAEGAPCRAYGPMQTQLCQPVPARGLKTHDRGIVQRMYQARAAQTDTCSAMC